MIKINYPKMPALFMGALLFLGACKKDSGPTYEPPVTEPLTISSAKLGETIVIKGQNFSTTASENVVTFNGVEATIVSATETEIVVIVPANATSGKVQITVHGHTTEIGTLNLAHFMLYAIKDHSDYVGTDYYRQIVSINPADGKETVLARLNDYTDFDVSKAVYASSTRELVGINSSRKSLAKFNIDTKQASSVKLSVEGEYLGIITDLSGNLYSAVRNWNTLQVSLVKIDPATGTVTTVKELGAGSWWSLTYLPATNEVVGLWEDEYHILKLSLTTKQTTQVQISSNAKLEYKQLVSAGSELYGTQYEFLGNDAALSLMKINATTGTTETVVADYRNYGDYLVYDPVRKEIVTLWKANTELFRFNINTKTSSVLTLTTSSDNYYGALTGN